jgi:hypothetical protein
MSAGVLWSRQDLSQPGLAQARAKPVALGRVAEELSKRVNFKERVQPPQLIRGARRRFQLPGFGIGHSECDIKRDVVRISTDAALRSRDGIVVTTLEVIRDRQVGERIGRRARGEIG